MRQCPSFRFRQDQIQEYRSQQRRTAKQPENPVDPDGSFDERKSFRCAEQSYVKYHERNSSEHPSNFRGEEFSQQYSRKHHESDGVGRNVDEETNGGEFDGVGRPDLVAPEQVPCQTEGGNGCPQTGTQREGSPSDYRQEDARDDGEEKTDSRCQDSCQKIVDDVFPDVGDDVHGVEDDEVCSAEGLHEVEHVNDHERFENLRFEEEPPVALSRGGNYGAVAREHGRLEVFVLDPRDEFFCFSLGLNR